MRATRAVLLLCPLGLLAGTAISLVAGCVVPQPNHCSASANEGDKTCLDRGQGMFCDGCRAENDGCVDEMPSEDCHVPPPESEGTTVGIESTGDEVTTVSPPTTDPPATSTGATPCTSNDDCSGTDTPFCSLDSGECVTCSGMPTDACAELDANLPVCVNDVCVQCAEGAADACTGTTPVCDGAANVCVCTAHDQCGEAACNFHTRECLPPETVVHVGGMMEFATLTEAVTSLADHAAGTIVVHTGTYGESVTVEGGRTLAFLSADGDPPIWHNHGGMPQLTVDGATVILDGLVLSLNQAMPAVPAIVVSGGDAWIDRSQIIDNDGGGISAQDDSALTLRNCFVGGDINDVSAVMISESRASVLYSTLAAGSFAQALALSCVEAVEVAVRGSIIVDRDEQGLPIDCPEADITYTAVEFEVSGEGNQNVGQMPADDPGSWFVGYPSGNFHLQDEGLTVFADIVSREPGDPSTDIDGHMRPTQADSPDYAGADVP